MMLYNLVKNTASICYELANDIVPDTLTYMKESEEADAIYKDIENCVSKDVFKGIAESIGRYGIECGKSGFIAGFEYAVKLIQDRGEGNEKAV